MRINTSEEIFGFPARQIRKLMRIGASGSWGTDFVAVNMGIEENLGGQVGKGFVSCRPDC
jgi:hypothetical protein